MTIRRLSVRLAGQIAAGEVVERPCSAVKELLENSVDAGASNIRCEIEGAGRVLIAVRDDGCGIPRDELPLALAPHATSKIATEEDLEAISTLGFRGEALASIAAVSKLTLTSRTQDESDGFQASCEGQDMDPVLLPAPHGVGTSVEARELFFNTPARRRFLKSDRTELARIRDVFVRCALAHPEIGFELISDGRSLIKVKGAPASDHKTRMRRLSLLAGGEFSEECMEVRCDDPALQIRGIILPPGDQSAGGSEKCFLFLNGRPIADRLAVHAVREACASWSGQRACPRCVLYLSCDPHDVDVNVHPRKDEVRFRNATAVHDLISGAVLEALKGFDDTQSAPLRFEGPESAPEIAAPAAPADAPEPAPASAIFASEPSALPEFPDGQGSFSAAPRPQAALAGENYLRRVRERSAVFNARLGAGSPSDTADMAVTEPAAPQAPRCVLAEPVPGTALVRLGGRFYLVSLKALRDELRCRAYEREVASGSVASFELIMPFSVRVPPAVLKALKKAPDSARRCGFELECQKSAVVLRKVPEELRGCDLAAFSMRAFSVMAASADLQQGVCPRQLSEAVALAKNAEPCQASEAEKLFASEEGAELLKALLGHGACDLRLSEQALALEGRE
ncbi:MAG: DNA mismatch repair endonuclease MutL [Succinivibrio sp.]|jgi:DNA mismatch repair protein MutL|nr:DNA mismatch repair endonuclease MutL [Succinivibrio sp.]